VGLRLWVRRIRLSLNLSMGAVYSLSIFIAAGVLLGGRIVEVLFYEWEYYGAHPWQIPAYWLGGMATHGILAGGLAGMLLFCLVYRKPFWPVADALAVAGAYIMGLGRIGNFIDGQIVGSVTSVPWAVKFPDAEGFRHPVVLYDGLKNLLLVPVLLLIRRSGPPAGVVLGHFLLWYGFLRIFIDLFRVYPTTLLGFPPGQEFNILMTVVGVALLVWRYRRPTAFAAAAVTLPAAAPAERRGFLWVKRAAFALLVAFPLMIPSDWTQDVPARYGKRHAGMKHSALYPAITEPPPAAWPAKEAP